MNNHPQSPGNLVRKVHLTWLCLFLCAVAICNPAHAQEDQPKDGRFYERVAVTAYRNKDYESFLKNMQLAAQLRPGHPRLMYNLAAAYSLTGHRTEALMLLNRIAKMGLIVPAAEETDFDSIRESTEFKTILKNFELNKAPIINSTPAFTLHEKGFIPESMAYDSKTKTFYLGSVYRRKIVAVDPSGTARDFSTDLDGSVMGMKVDVVRRQLWVCTAAHPQMANYKPAENGNSAILKFDLVTGKLVKKYLLTNKPKPHWLGDLVLSSDGDVFTSDSVSPAVYVIRRRSDELVLFVENKEFASPQGLVFAPGEKILFLADYANGIFAIDQESRKVTRLPGPENTTLLGIDGLYHYHGSLLGVQNGVNPARLIRLRLNQKMNRIERLETIEANNPVFDEPTLGVIDKDTFYFIANSQWGAIDAKGQLASDDKLTEPIVLKIKLRP
ncbi:MAG TPA: hypothetical protein VGN90_04930 [Pyrinomonadaceae bacterium]|jgi:hypothetical protein|nr:hypothetical protein [Pyrinomonadaceae bacterium]